MSAVLQARSFSSEELRPAVLAPGNQTLDRREIPRVAEAHDDLLRTRLAQGVEPFGRRGQIAQAGGIGAGNPLDRRRVATDLAAALIEEPILAGEGRGICVAAVPELGILRGQAQRDLLAAATDQDRQGVAQWSRRIDLPAVADDLQPLAQGR